MHAPINNTQKILDFLQNTQINNIPQNAQQWGRLCLLDIIGTAISATATTTMSNIIRNYTATMFPPGTKSAHILFDGRSSTPQSAAMASATTIDAMDCHDGQKLTKGHVGCAMIPSIIATLQAENKNIKGSELLNLIIIGYEIGTRCGIAMHESAPDYHASGAWISIAIAAITAHILKLSNTQITEACGIAEYFAPRSQMMRCIDAPTMVKDSSGMGAFTGISAAYLAQLGFTGAPAITMQNNKLNHIWQNLNQKWYMQEQYLKLYPVCRWAQPAIAAAQSLIQHHSINKKIITEISEIHVDTFHEAKRLACKHPQNTEQAQYSLPFPLATFILNGKLTPEHVTGKNLNNKNIIALTNKIHVSENPQFNKQFPAQRIAQITIKLNNGTTLTSKPMQAQGDPENPLSQQQIIDKFLTNSTPHAPQKTIDEIIQACLNIDSINANELINLITPQLQ